MRIYIISLKSAGARRTAVAEQFAGLGFAYEFFDAITGCVASEHFNAIDPAPFRLNTCRSALAGEIGCYASHLSLWKRSVELNEPIVVLEDDCHLNGNFPDAIRATSQFIDRFGFIRLQSHERPRRRLRYPAACKILDFDEFSLAYLSDVPLCLLAYAINPAAAANLVRASATLTAPVDKFVQRTWEHQTPIFALTPASVATSVHANVSTIGDRSGKSKDPALLLKRSFYKLLGEIRRKPFDKRQLRRFADARRITSSAEG